MHSWYVICVHRERIAKAKSIFDKRALELLNRAKLKKSKLKQKGATLPLQGHSNKPDYSQVLHDTVLAILCVSVMSLILDAFVRQFSH